MAEQEAKVIEEAPSTKINKMEMKGFKSFANRIEVPFGDRFNCILGPNGSGKSNVLDALCFVLGKAGAKGLRAEKSANLIYNGGKTKKPAKQGEVHIYFDNTDDTFPIDGDEVKISRVVKKSGSSDYLINDENATRTQIVDLLSHARINPDGYNIILQGDIVRLVEMSPNERRGIIEEISGINIYEDKKAKASRELDRVEQQLKEAEIVLAERKTYLSELKKERDQAMRFKELDEKIRRNKATVLHRKKTSREKSVSELEEKRAQEEEKIASIQETIDDLKKQVLEKKAAVDDISREVEEKGEKEQVQLMKQVEDLRIQIATSKQRQEELKREQDRIAQRRKELEQSQKDVDSKVSRIEKDLQVADKRIDARQADREKLDKKVADFRSKNDLESAAEVDERIHEIDASAEKVQEQISGLREQQQTLLRDKDKLDYQIQTIDEKMAKVLEAQKENKEQLKVLRARQSELTKVKADLDSSLDRASEVASELTTAKGKLSTRQEDLAKAQARQAQIRERVAGSNAVQEVLKLKSKDKSIYGTVAELGSVSEQYSLALEIAAGSRLKSVVVEDDSTAQRCIDHLKSSRSGVATFLPLTKLRARTVPQELRSLKGKGVHGLALDLVSFDKKFEKAFQHVLGSTLVVDDINAARRVGIGKARMVTLDGDMIEASGAMSGGYRARKKGAGAGFQEEELSEKLASLGKDVADYQNLVTRLSSEQQELSESIDSLRQRRRELEDEIAQLERELHIDSADMDASKEKKDQLKAEAKSLDDEVDEVVSSISDKNKELAKLKMEKHELREKITELRNPQMLAELNAFEQQRSAIGEEIVQIRTERDGLKRELDSIHLPERENIQKILDQQSKEKQQFEKEAERITGSLKEKESELKEKEKREEAFRKQFKELFEKRSKLQEAISKLEEKVIGHEEKIRAAEHRLSAANVQMASVKAELAGVDEELKDFQGVEPYKTKADDDIQREIKQFERMVDDLGAVNMKALDMYDTVEREYTSLVEKKEVLGAEREDVLVMINEIDAKKRELFMRTFDAIENHFKEIFLTLSRKGEAFLELENPEDPFAGGLNIRVRLSGKKFMDIRSLSGGEKTMTALAFLFAIQEYQPASFYVLDEVDAALDKKNSERLAELVERYADQAQYILISHNDTVISEADKLFGVSMNEHGESQVTTLKI